MNEQENQHVPEDVQEFAGKLFELARTGDVVLLDYVDNGVDVNLANQDGNTFLMLATYAGHLELARGLVERGANVDKLNARGQSPLAGVIFKKEDEIVELLLHAGADPRAGHPDAIATARMFGREDLADRMQ
ncbi:ankyrin repeat domain-containing protein [Corynebacterium lipophiloflavum]|uniref:Ankyrin repeat protein n=1 Tax=Corynebacterium lipophiloflavum (strain ATCC 700352 / DSM 44291 / CCUG 37336 / JCM 10383 / DMMZ 1944) TaxID=525263 RepID=C0XRJ7_CORLD|nr:ankyrin repeat domain-containing protein [Corynebacterium lipophiloflavum]EEI17129.1 ankyrin repeat protein [Corynebacterium lipophiloflavum DSM 44291]